MKIVLPLLAMLLLFQVACSGRKSVPAVPKFQNIELTNRSSIVTHDTSLSGKVVTVNREARFVVLNFPIGRLPAMEQRLGVYRGGVKVGEVRITGPQRDDNIVADITNGEAGTGDEVRDR